MNKNSFGNSTINYPILSICIPTYNRGEILAKTLEGYIKDPAFDESVEIVISDNCSTDCTQELVSKYLIQYKNIKYKRLPENIGPDLNMNMVLSMGRGLYLKLMNDTVTLRSGVLKLILDVLGLERIGMKPIFFYQNISFSNSNKSISCSDLNELVSNVSFWVTWISNFGIWRKDFEVLENKNRLAHLQFPHADWTFRQITKNKSAIIQFDDYYNVAELGSKGGYNVFQTFGVNYLSLYDEYLSASVLNKYVIRKEKYRLFRYFLMNWYQILVLSKDNKFIFEKNNAFDILRTSYKNNPYFYLGILYLLILNVLRKTKKIIFAKKKRSNEIHAKTTQ